jgi:hypothetical protein
MTITLSGKRHYKIDISYMCVLLQYIHCLSLPEFSIWFQVRWYLILFYLKKFVSYLQQIGGFLPILWFSPPIMIHIRQVNHIRVIQWSYTYSLGSIKKFFFCLWEKASFLFLIAFYVKLFSCIYDHQRKYTFYRFVENHQLTFNAI